MTKLKYVRKLRPDELRALPVGTWWLCYGTLREHRLGDLTPTTEMLNSSYRYSMCGNELIKTSRYLGISDGTPSLNDGMRRCKACARCKLQP
jgi:hypothetical protein